MRTFKYTFIFLIALFALLHGSFALALDASVDTDGDGFTDQDEILHFHTDPTKVDSDGDGFSDSVEVYSGYNPTGPGRAVTSAKRVEVNLSNQTLTYYYNDVALGTIPVSTGILKWATPTGDFKVFRKVPAIHYVGVGYDYPNTKWNLEFLPHIYLHGAYWHHDFGIRPRSHGCVNIAYKDVEKLYQFLDVGDEVKVVGKTPRVVDQKSIALNN